MPETVESSSVGLRTLMGGTLTAFIAFDQSSVVGRGEYIDTLLGPERTRECFLLGKITTRLGLQSYREGFRILGWC